MPFLKRDKAFIFYVAEGTGPAILLLHGWACDSLDWQYQIPFLHSLGYQTIAFDARGHGASSVPPADEPEQLRAEVTADDAVAVLEHLGVPSAILLSHSAGALVASIIAARNPAVAKANIMVDPEHYREHDGRGQFIEALKAAAQGTMIRTLAQSYSENTPEWLKTWHRYRILRTPPHVIYQSLRVKSEHPNSVACWDSAKVWMRERKGPRLVVLRDETNLEKERSLGLGGKDSIEIFSGAGHWMHVLEPERFNNLLKGWLESAVTNE
ncbi:Alpha/Beta hydrolase protein [Xylaria bambusicola]|uniref:Alpha/Beta hydrolase protein n=1 Tax=Xylaria bambusicola TaxID=326684 RepID=UPI00200841BE|nr:Alpha/Beta hydrolase protein [Xylaria bambusicola]KAI0505628.1 Alpha/Beta hydrolase protein [Xylaria bambusicola]